MSEQPTSILINLMGSLGDVARGLTLVAPLKRAYPNVEITWLVEPKCFELVSLHPAVNRIIVFQRGKGVASIIKLCRELRAKKYDLCLNLILIKVF